MAASASSSAENKSPKRKPGLLDNRGSHFYLALYWADAMANQVKAPELAAKFALLPPLPAANEERILEELLLALISPADIGGGYKVDAAKADEAVPAAALHRSPIRAERLRVFIDDADPIARAATLPPSSPTPSSSIIT